MFRGLKDLHLSPLRLQVRGLRHTRQPFVALVELWGSHRLPPACPRDRALIVLGRFTTNMLVLTFDCRGRRHPLRFIVLLHRLAHQRQRGFRLLLLKGPIRTPLIRQDKTQQRRDKNDPAVRDAGPSPLWLPSFRRALPTRSCVHRSQREVRVDGLRLLLRPIRGLGRTVISSRSLEHARLPDLRFAAICQTSWSRSAGPKINRSTAAVPVNG